MLINNLRSLYESATKKLSIDQTRPPWHFEGNSIPKLSLSPRGFDKKEFAPSPNPLSSHSTSSNCKPEELQKIQTNPSLSLPRPRKDSYSRDKQVPKPSQEAMRLPVPTPSAHYPDPMYLPHPLDPAAVQMAAYSEHVRAMAAIDPRMLMDPALMAYYGGAGYLPTS